MERNMIEEYLNYLHDVRGLALSSCTAYRHDLELWKKHLEVCGVSLEQAGLAEAGSFLRSLGKLGLKASSINRILSCLRSFYRFFVRLGILKKHPFSAIRGLKQPRSLPKVLFEHEMSKLLYRIDNSCEAQGFQVARDRCLFELLYATGCRVAEVCSLKLSDFSSRSRRIRIFGKGHKERLVFLTDQAQKALNDYLPWREKRLDISCSGACQTLFLNWLGRPLTVRGIAKILTRYVNSTGLNKKVSPHTFRHSFATHFMNQGLDIRIIQELLGHSRLETTQVYTHLCMDKLKDIVRMTHPHG